MQREVVVAAMTDDPGALCVLLPLFSAGPDSGKHGAVLQTGRMKARGREAALNSEIPTGRPARELS